MSYIEKFLEKNDGKPFIFNLKNYTELSFWGKCKVVSSFLTHLYIDAEQCEVVSKEDFDENIKMQTELLSILTELTLYKIDNFIEWLE